MRGEKDGPGTDETDALRVRFQDLQHPDQKKQEEMKGLLARALAWVSPEATMCYLQKFSRNIKMQRVCTIG